MGWGVWAAWLFLVSSGFTWVSDVEVNGYYLAYLMLVMSISSAVVCLAAPFAQRLYDTLLMRRSLLTVVALLASVGALAIVGAGPYYLNTPLLFWPGIVLIGIFSGLFSLKCGQLFGALNSRRVLFYALLSELMMVATSYFVLGNDFYRPMAGGPSLSGILAFALLPLIATYLVCLPAGDAPDTPSQRREGEAAAASTARESIPSAFWRFLVIVFVFTVISETVRCYFVFARLPSLTHIDFILVLLFRTLFAILMLGFALRPYKQLRFGRMYLFSLVGIAVVMALIPLFQTYNTILGSLIGLASNVMVFLIWCLLASVVFEKQVSSLVVFGFGRGALLAGQVCGWLLGIWVLPKLAGTSWELVCYVGLAIVTLATVTLFFSEKQFDRLFGEIAQAQVGLDFSLLRKEDWKKHRPWREACRRVGEQAMLSAREQEIFELLVSGRSPENIAVHLVLSLNTVRTHIRNIYAKFDVHNKAELILHVETVFKETSGNLIP
jgi:DNA-binding CsgD family transcriptional regulator